MCALSLGEYITKTKGAANEAIGKARVSVGQNTESPKLIIEVIKQQAKGQVPKLVGGAKGVLDDKV